MRDVFAIGWGILITALVGLFCKKFLDWSVTQGFPTSFSAFKSAEKGGGGKCLGILERLLFFASLWLGRYEAAAGWLAFKVAAKWATWQHIVKLPEVISDDALKNRLQLASRLLGRFLNGTIYNVLLRALVSSQQGLR